MIPLKNLNRTVKVVAVMAVLALLFAATPVMAQGRQDFNLINRTGYDIDEVYVSPSSEEAWEEDVLGQDILPDGARVHIRFPHRPGTCLWDLLVVWEDEEEAEWHGLNLCETTTVVIRYDRTTDRTWVEYE